MAFDESKEFVEVLTPVGVRREFPIKLRIPSLIRSSGGRVLKASVVTLLTAAVGWSGYRLLQSTAAYQQAQAPSVQQTVQVDRESLKAELKAELLKELGLTPAALKKPTTTNRQAAPADSAKPPEGALKTPTINKPKVQIPSPRPVPTKSAPLIAAKVPEVTPQTPRRSQTAAPGRLVTESVLDDRLTKLARDAGLLSKR